MKQYKVLAAHVGDKEYAPGDTRIADPNVVKHLVPAVLEEEGDAPTAPLPVVEPTGYAAVSDLQQQVAALTQERDDARAKFAEMENDRATVISERDAARAELAAKVETPPAANGPETPPARRGRSQGAN